MAGYMTKLQGYVYEGELVNGAETAVPNGAFMLRGEGEGKLIFPGSTVPVTNKFICKEVGTIYDGRVAYRFVVDNIAGGRIYFVENGFDINDAAAYDKAEYATAAGDYLRAHPLLIGEEFWTDQIAEGVEVTVGGTYAIGNDGKLTELGN